MGFTVTFLHILYYILLLFTLPTPYLFLLVSLPSPNTSQSAFETYISHYLLFEVCLDGLILWAMNYKALFSENSIAIKAFWNSDYPRKSGAVSGFIM